MELVHTCLQQLHLLALHFEILGYIPGLLRSYLDKRFNGLNLTAGIKVRKVCIELGIRTEDAECNLRGVKVILNLIVIIIVVRKVMIPSREKRHIYRL